MRMEWRMAWMWVVGGWKGESSSAIRYRADFLSYVCEADEKGMKHWRTCPTMRNHARDAYLMRSPFQPQAHPSHRAAHPDTSLRHHTPDTMTRLTTNQCCPQVQPSSAKFSMAIQSHANTIETGRDETRSSTNMAGPGLK